MPNPDVVAIVSKMKGSSGDCKSSDGPAPPMGDGMPMSPDEAVGQDLLDAFETGDRLRIAKVLRNAMRIFGNRSDSL